MFLRLLSLFGLALLLCACTTSTLENANQNLGTDYMPLTKGATWIYEVREVTFSLNPVPDTSRFWLREQAVDTFTNLSGGISYRLERSKSFNQGSSWAIDSVWIGTLTNSQYLRTENNQTRVKLVFPLREGGSWLVNSFNNNANEGQRAMIQRFNRSAVIGTNSYTRTMQIGVLNDSSCVGRNFLQETYAAGVGLVQLNKRQVRFADTNPPCSSPLPVIGGTDLRLTLLNYTNGQ